MNPGILAIDIGGTGLKAAVVSEAGRMLSERLRVPTPHPCPPGRMLAVLAELVRPLPAYDRIAIGFPGVVRDGRVVTAPHLDTRLWQGYELAAALSGVLGGHPARMVNDADMQGYALIRASGLELVVTLGTGMGTALYRDGELMPHMELSQHPFRKDRTYDDYLGSEALARIGRKRWNRRLGKALEMLRTLLNPDRVFLAGGNARLVGDDHPAWVHVSAGGTGMEGGAHLWRAPGPRRAARKR